MTESLKHWTCNQRTQVQVPPLKGTGVSFKGTHRKNRVECFECSIVRSDTKAPVYVPPEDEGVCLQPPLTRILNKEKLERKGRH